MNRIGSLTGFVKQRLIPLTLKTNCIRQFSKQISSPNQVHKICLKNPLNFFNRNGIFSKSVFKSTTSLLTSTAIVSALKNSKVYCNVEEEESFGRFNEPPLKHEEGKSPFQWRKLLQLLAPDKFLLLIAVACALVVAVINIQIPLMIGKIANIVADCSGKSVALKTFATALTIPAQKIIGLYFLQAGFTTMYISTLSIVGENMAKRLREELFANYMRQDIAFFDKHRTGELVNRLTTDIQDFKSSFKSCVSQGLKNSAQTVGCFASLYAISPKMTVLMIVTLPSIIFFGSLFGSMLRKLSRKAHAQVERSTIVADEALGNIRTVRAFAMENNEIDLFKRELEKSSDLNEQLGLGIGIFQGLSNLSLNGVVLGVIFTGGLMIHRKEITKGDLMSFLIASQTIQRSIAQLSLLLGYCVKGMIAGNRVFEYTNLQPITPLKGGLTIPYHSLTADIEFKNVTFSYPTRPEQIVLKDFNLRIPPGKVVALCGVSGGGKSTVAALLERFYDVHKGFITLDKKDIRTMDPSWLRGEVIGYISQEPVLFATSIMENIRYGRPNATEQEVIEAATLANAHEFIECFPDGYSTVLGERGVTISGGQKQRIAIARAFLKNPSVLILDEATSALDAESEKIVQCTLDQIVKGRTVLIIAHRLSTIQNADIIAVLADGAIAEIGTHESLKKLNGLYCDLIKQQEKSERSDKSLTIKVTNMNKNPMGFVGV